MPVSAASRALDRPRAGRRRLLAAAGSALAALGLAGCGFRLRGPQKLDFATLYVGASEFSEFGAELRRIVATSGTTAVVTDPARAEARLAILANERDREILSLTGAGRVREYQISQRLRFQLVDRAGKVLIAPTTLTAQREYTFDDSQVLGKEQEEALLYRDMQHDLLQQLMRRLAAARRTG